MMGDGWVLDADIIKFEPQAITTLYKHDHGSRKGQHLSEADTKNQCWRGRVYTYKYYCDSE